MMANEHRTFHAFGDALGVFIPPRRRYIVVSQYTTHGYEPLRPNVVRVTASLSAALRSRDTMTYSDDVGRSEAVVIDATTGREVTATPSSA